MSSAWTSSSVEACLTTLKSIEKDLDGLREAWLTKDNNRRIGFDSYTTVMQSLRDKQVEILKVMGQLSGDPVDRWQKIIGD